MNRLLTVLFLGALALCAQNSPAPVQQTATHLDAATFVATSATSAATLTITPPAGQYVYITGGDISNCASGSSVTAAAQTAITTTNLSGIQWQIGVGPAAGLCQAVFVNPGNTTLKSAAPGLAVTIVMPTFGTNQTLRANFYYYVGY